MSAKKISATFQHPIYSPKGGVEGLLVEVDGEPVQVVIEKDDEAAAALVGVLRAGQSLSLDAAPAEPSKKKGEPAHAVWALRKVLRVDGKAPKAAKPHAAGYSGKIVRLNYARHGAPNGYVLDTGDFVHVKPEGFEKLGLDVGDQVDADGDAYFLSTGGGWAIEADTVNGRAVK
jgi:hypothetical protein